jgi:hypothetical protein
MTSQYFEVEFKHSGYDIGGELKLAWQRLGGDVVFRLLSTAQLKSQISNKTASLGALVA